VFTFFFNAGSNLDPSSDAGIAPWAPTNQVGDYIYATSPTMYDVSTYCSP